MWDPYMVCIYICTYMYLSAWNRICGIWYLPTVLDATPE